MRVPLVTAAALIGMALVVAPSSVSAMPLGGISKDIAPQMQSTDSTLLQQVQNGRRGGHRGGSSAGAAAAGTIFGLAIGAITGEAARHQQAVEWCMRHYRSYDPRDLDR